LWFCIFSPNGYTKCRESKKAVKNISWLIDIQNVCKTYGAGSTCVEALKGVQLQIARGEFLAIVGNSGSGKSTLMNILGCLDTPTSGSYLLNGQRIAEMDVDRLSEIRNREIGFVFQGFNLIPSLNAWENVELPLFYRGVPKAQRKELAMQALEAVGLKNRTSHKPSEMSGGQQQRVAIARAIAAKPEIILADEPTGNLDGAAEQEILKILKSLHQSGKTIIVITHNLDIARQAQKRVRLTDGRLLH